LKYCPNTGPDGTWDYVDGVVYNNNAIVFVQTETGRAIPIAGVYHYEHNLTDNLGASGLNRIQARIWEQNLINEHGLDNLLNIRNSIAQQYWQLFGVTP
jgi:hypothetical protein